MELPFPDSEGQLLTATSSNTAAWLDPAGIYSSGLGINSTLLAKDIIQIEISKQFKFSGSSLDLNIIPIELGGTGRNGLVKNRVIIGNGYDPVNVSMDAPKSPFVGTLDNQTLECKTLTSNTNNITSSSLFSNHGENSISIFASPNPLPGQVLTAISGSIALWKDPLERLPLFAGPGIHIHDDTVIKLIASERFTFVDETLELKPVSVEYGGTGHTEFPNNTVLIGNGDSIITKPSPQSDFVGINDAQILTNKILTSPHNNITARSIFVDNTKTISIEGIPKQGQTLTATSEEIASWTTPPLIGIYIQNISDRFELDGTLELSTVLVPFGGTGHESLPRNSVLIGDGINKVNTSKQAPIGDFVGTTDRQELEYKTVTNPNNNIAAKLLHTNDGMINIVSESPNKGDVLTAINSSKASWKSTPSPLSPGKCIDITDNEIHLEISPRFSVIDNKLDLEVIPISYGGTGHTSLKSNCVLIGNEKQSVLYKQAPNGNFVGTSDKQDITNKTIIDPSNNVVSSALFTNNGTVDVRDSDVPTEGQVLTAISESAAIWKDPSPGYFVAGPGICIKDNVIKIDISPRIMFTDNQIDIPTVGVLCGGTGRECLEIGKVLIGNNHDPVITNMKAPESDFVGIDDIQELKHKTLIDNSNNISANKLRKVNIIPYRPTRGQVLTATNEYNAMWLDPTPGNLISGPGIKVEHDIISVEITPRLSLSGNKLDLSTIQVAKGGTGRTTLPQDKVLIGNGNEIDVSREAPTSDFVGTTDKQTLRHKTLTSNTNDVTAKSLFTNSGGNTISISDGDAPKYGHVLTAISSTEAVWKHKQLIFYATLDRNLHFDNILIQDDIYEYQQGVITILEMGIYEITYRVSDCKCWLMLNSNKVEGSYTLVSGTIPIAIPKNSSLHIECECTQNNNKDGIDNIMYIKQLT